MSKPKPWKHQVTAVDKMLEERKNGHGILLADEMGLGKTWSLGFYMQHILSLLSATKGPLFFIIVPVCVFEHWLSTLSKLEIDTVLLHSSNDDLRTKDKLNDLLPYLKKTRAIVTSAETLHSIFKKPNSDLSKWLKRHQFDTRVIDEGDKFRGLVNNKFQLDLEGCKRGEAVCEIKAKYTYPLTGSPLHNSLSDLAALAYLIGHGESASPEFWKNPDAVKVEQWFKDYVVRRTKEQGFEISGIAMPKLVESQRKFKSSPIQRELHRLVFAKLEKDFQEHKKLQDKIKLLKQKKKAKSAEGGSALTREAKVAGTGQMMNDIRTQLMTLRQVCNAPDIIKAKCPELYQEARQACPVDPLLTKNQQLMHDAPKLAGLVQHCREHLSTSGRKSMLIFSQWTQTLDLIQGLLQDELKLEDAPPMYCGTVSKGKRDRMIQQFQEFYDQPASFQRSNQHQRILLIQLQCGGVGLNCMAADQVVLFDQWYDPQASIQAIGRAHRIGQANTTFADHYVPEEDWMSERWLLKVQHKKLEEFAPLIKDLKKYTKMFQNFNGSTEAVNFTFKDYREMVRRALLELFTLRERSAISMTTGTKVAKNKAQTIRVDNMAKGAQLMQLSAVGAKVQKEKERCEQVRLEARKLKAKMSFV